MLKKKNIFWIIFQVLFLAWVFFSGVLWADDRKFTETDIFEDFTSGAGGFTVTELSYVSNGRYFFRGNGTGSNSYFLDWNGGLNSSGNWYPQHCNSNFFEDFKVSVDTLWEGGADNSGYGLIICLQKDNSIQFWLDGKGESFYAIAKNKDGNYEQIFEWKQSSHIKDGQQNNLSVLKQGDNYSFYINNTLIEQLVIDGFCGGAIGVMSMDNLDVSFDNFRIERLSNAASVIDSDGDGVIDQWDQCPDTPSASIVYSNGCPAVKGDFDNDGKLGLGDCTGILQILTGIRAED